MLITEILDLLFGRKYYANIINVKGTGKYEMTSYIFSNKEDAKRHEERVKTTLSFIFVETISFRSKREYGT